MCMQTFITTFHSVQEIGPLSLFQNLDLGEANAILQSLRLCLVKLNVNVYAKFYQNIFCGSRVMGNFLFFTIWTSAKPRQMENSIRQSRRLDLVNINVYAKFHQNVPCGIRDRAMFTFFQNLDPCKAWTDEKRHLATLGLDLVHINVYVKFYQNIPHGSRVMSDFRKMITDGHTTSQTAYERTHTAILVHTPKVDHDLLRVVQY